MYKLEASGFPESGAACELRMSGERIPLVVSVNPLQLSVSAINTPGVYKLVCSISGKEYVLDRAVTAFDNKLAVSRVEPSELSVGDNLTEVVLIDTAGRIVNGPELSARYGVVDATGLAKRSRRAIVPVPRFTKIIPAEYLSPTQCKCNI